MEDVLKGLNKSKLSKWRCQFCSRLMYFYGISPNQLGVEKDKCERCGKVNNVLIFEGKARPINDKLRQETLIKLKNTLEKLGLSKEKYFDILNLIK